MQKSSQAHGELEEKKTKVKCSLNHCPWKESTARHYCCKVLIDGSVELCQFAVIERVQRAKGFKEAGVIDPVV